MTSYKYLGVTITEQLYCSKNTKLLVKKGQQRLYFMRILRSSKVDKTILQLFHRALVETVLTFSIICWFSQLIIRDRTKLQRVIFRSSKTAGTEFPPLDHIHLLHITGAILADPSHPLQPPFVTAKSGKLYIFVKARTK